MPISLTVGDIVEMKKQHPCGCKNFEITRVGMDVKIKCLGCSKIIMLDRRTFEKRMKKFIERKNEEVE
ncbi:MAG: DUF951 domain-containing protein [Clostridioides sp.]|nr:DUF951 domain-containing protein [Clostridioides sp.]